MTNYFERGGLRWGNNYMRASNATWPFATLEISERSLLISVGFGAIAKRFEFGKEDICRLRFGQGISSSGLQIEHTVEEYPALIIFWTFAPNALQAALKEWGCNVEIGFSDDINTTNLPFRLLFSLGLVLVGGGIFYFAFESIGNGHFLFNGMPVSRENTPFEFWLLGSLFLAIGTLVFSLGARNLYRWLR